MARFSLGLSWEESCTAADFRRLRDRRVFNRSLQGSADMSLSYVVYTTSGDFHFYLAGFASRTPFTFDIEEAQYFDTYGHAYEAAVHVERDFHRPTHIAPIERRTYGRR